MPDWNIISYVQASEIRFKILVCLNTNVKTPTALKKELNVPISRVSAILKELLDSGLIENLSPTRRKNKIFSLTEKGKSVLNDIHTITKTK